MTAKSASAIVIGGGVIGLSSALALQARGYRVQVLERGDFARQASWAGGGILTALPPWDASPVLWQFVREGAARYPEWCNALREETGIDPEWWRCGMTVRGGDLDAARRWCAAMGLVIELGPDTAHLPWVAQVRNPKLCRALLAILQGKGVTLTPHCGALQLGVTEHRAWVQLTHKRLHADAIVVAAGAWSTSLLSPLGWTLPVWPVKGQMLALRGEPGVLEHIVFCEGRYLIPRQDGLVLIGSTLEQTGFDDSISAEAEVVLRAFATAQCPALTSSAVAGHWAGLRPGSPEGIPIIARHQQIENLYANTGHFRYGLTMAPAAAERLAALVSTG